MPKDPLPYVAEIRSLQAELNQLVTVADAIRVQSDQLLPLYDTLPDEFRVKLMLSHREIKNLHHRVQYEVRCLQKKLGSIRNQYDRQNKADSVS